MNLKPCLLVLVMLSTLVSYGQQSLNWYNPLEQQAVSGRIADHQQATTTYHRLPAGLKDVVRPPVWSLGTNAAGLYIDFHTGASAVTVRYKMSGSLNMPHMPTTGVSGLDLYAYDDISKDWKWAYGKYSFGDTTSFTFSKLGNGTSRTYRLYLPLYNTVEWMQIGVEDGQEVKFVLEKEKPIIVYGTSIAQGACASRPGLAWTNILGRQLKLPVVNLGFSGNGRLEQPILSLIGEVDARVFVLDCIPNLSLNANLSERQLDSLLTNAVSFLRKKHPNTPIILTEHSAGFDDDILNIGSAQEYTASTKVLRAFMDRMKKEKVQQLYLLTNKEMAMDLESTVDYAHPNDLGMMKIAVAYQRLIKKIVK